MGIYKEPMDWLYFLILGIATGIYGVMVGTGGGIILVPNLLILFNFEPAMAAGTSMFLVAVNSFSGSIFYIRENLVDRRSGIMFALAAIPGSLIAPFALKGVSPEVFRSLFGILLILLSIYLIYRTFITRQISSEVSNKIKFGLRQYRWVSGKEIYSYKYNEILAAIFNFCLGFLSAFFGTGGGFLRTPVLVTFFGFPLRVAVATSIFALSIYSTTGAAVHTVLGHTDWFPTVLAVSPGLLFGSRVGVWFSSKVSSKGIVVMLSILLIVMGFRLVLQVFL